MRTICLLLAVAAASAADRDLIPPGGANAPEPTAPPAHVVETIDLRVPGTAAWVRIPTGEFEDLDGAANHTVPGPIVAFRGEDEVWRGHSYLETYPRVIGFTGSYDGAEGETWTASLNYAFESGSYDVELRGREGRIEIDATSDLGPRNCWVFDCYHGWQTTAAVAFGDGGRASLYLPCHYDRVEARLDPRDAGGARGIAVLGAGVPVAAAFWMRDPDSWEGGSAMSAALWQRRQLGGRPGSRHFQAPETKSDGTPNPATAEMIGESRYEGHVTLEFNLGRGTRKLGFAPFPFDRDAGAPLAPLEEVIGE